MKLTWFARTAALLAVLACAPPAANAEAALRVPQVSVLGGTLQALLQASLETLDVHTQQLARQSWPDWGPPLSSGYPYYIQLELYGNASHNSVGLYDASAAVPEFFEVFPAVATELWYAGVAFKNSPTRVVVQVFDDQTVLRSTAIHLGLGRNNFGFSLRTPGGTFHTQDAHNSAGDPQALIFSGTGVYGGAWWVAWEEQPLHGGSNQDFGDCVILMTHPVECCCGPACTDIVERSTWGQVKAHFR